MLSKIFAATFAGLLFGATAAAGPALSPVDSFVADKEFCAYMVALPETEDDAFVARYAAAMQAAVTYMQHREPRITQTKAFFAMRAKCDMALKKRIHYR